MNRLARSWRLLARAASTNQSSISLLAAGDAAPLLPLAARPHAVHWRGFAAQQRANKAPSGSYATPPAASRAANVRITMVSSNVLAEPYRGPPPRQPASSWVTPSGWRERWRRWVNGAKSVYTVSKCKRNIKGWTLPGFKEEALQVYQAACAALAAGDRTALRHLASPAVYSDLKRQIKQREDAGWARVDWALPSPPTLKEIEVVQGRMVAADPKDDATAFAQLTVCFRSAQRFAAYDRRGGLVAGDPGAELAVVDHWVFERPLKGPSGSRWRVAGRLTVPPQLGAGQPQCAAAAVAAAPHGELQSQRRPQHQQQQAAQRQRQPKPLPS